MGRYLVGRLISMIPIIFLVSLVTFLLIHLSGGDPIEIMLGGYPTQELIEATRHQLGLDKPIYLQYLRWAFHLVQGDLGRSIRTKEPVTHLIRDTLPTTLILVLSGLGISLALAVPAGIVAGVKAGSGADHASTTFALLGVSVPNFFTAIVLILVFAVYLRWLPTSGSWILPAVALGLPFSAITTRMLRTSILETRQKPFVQVLEAKGLPQRYVVRHLVKASLIPVITLVAMQFAIMLGEAMIIEWIFALPGMGRLLIRATFQRDIPVVQGIVLVITLGFLISSLIADVLYAAADPRIRYGTESKVR